MKIPVFGMIAAVSLAIAGASSQAATSSASVTGITLTYADLDPTDGIAPMLTAGAASSGYAAGLDSQALPGSWVFADGFLTGGSLVVPYGQYPNAGVSGSMSTAGSIVVEADAALPGGAEIGGFASEHWLVTPHTSITLSADIVLQATGDARQQEIVDVCLLYFNCAPFQTASEGTFSHFSTVTVSNVTSQSLDVEVSIAALAVVPGVPELPASATLLAAGALLVARRRLAPRRRDTSAQNV